MFLDVVRIACGSLPVHNITPMGQDAQTMSEQGTLHYEQYAKSS